MKRKPKRKSKPKRKRVITYRMAYLADLGVHIANANAHLEAALRSLKMASKIQRIVPR